ncbi:MAG TPA: Ig-like domain repeat protein [Tepidiformaceae bacterium]|nr:Ig-like domain repeat protein [Tepidiformaceae bacterium]
MTPSDTGSTITVRDGTVDFSAGSSPLCTGVAVTNGAAQCVLDGSSTAALGLLAGLHTADSPFSLTAAYTDAAGNFLASSATPLSEAVTTAATTTTAAVSNTTPLYGDSITITAHVAANAPSVIDPGDDPSAAGAGTVTFEIDGVTDSGCALLPVKSGDATAQCALPVLPAGSHSIHVLYNPGTDYTTSDTTIPLDIAKAGTVTTLTSSADPALTGESVTLTATVTAQPPATLNPDTDGTVTFTDTTTGSTLCSGVALVGGQALCTATFSTNGPHAISGDYSGDANYNASSGTLTETIRSTTTTMVSAAYYDTAPAPTFAITATVTSPSGLVVDEGSVSFYAGGTLLCTVAVNSGQAMCEAPAGPLGGNSHTLTASYLGTENFLPSSGSAGSTANPAAPTIVTITSTTPGAGWLVQGAGFSGTTTVTVCGLSVPFTLVNDTTILIGVPAVNGPQQCVVVVTGAGGTASSSGTITVVPQPQPGAPVAVFPSGPGSGPAAAACNGTTQLTLSGQWTLITWPGAATPIAQALAGGSDGCGTDVSSLISVIWGFDAATQTYHAYFPGAAGVPGANDLTTLTQGAAYWVGLTNPSSTLTWTVSS